jgi:hypothetical protein
MTLEILKIKLELRLEEFVEASKHDLIAGLLDTYELEQIKGRIKELEIIIKIVDELLTGIPNKIEILCIRTNNDE